jgi:hypothetical protein
VEVGIKVADFQSVAFPNPFFQICLCLFLGKQLGHRLEKVIVICKGHESRYHREKLIYLFNILSTDIQVLNKIIHRKTSITLPSG